VSVTESRTFGGQTSFEPLRRVLVRPPSATALARWREYGWRSEPDASGIAREHEQLCALLEGAGAEVVLAEPLDDDPDAIYTHDPAITCDAGAILLRPGKEGRRGEVPAIERDLERAGVPVAGRLAEPEPAEGGDTLWLDERTFLAGRGYRTNSDGIWAIERQLPGVEVLVFDLPHWHGEGEVMHLMSLISPLDRDLALVYAPLMPTRLMQLLAERGIRTVEVPDDEFDSMGCNVLALAPRVALALDGNPETRRRLERAGVQVLVYSGQELSLKGDGGPTCLTRPLLRG
jgi:N-dimethylarginine dimethylaminohydrolase